MVDSLCSDDCGALDNELEDHNIKTLYEFELCFFYIDYL
jgi:hypothetical protein